MPTREGAVTLALAGFFFFLATNLQAGWLFLLMGVLLAALVVGWWSARSGVRGLVVEVRAVPPVVEGEPVAVPLEIRRRGRGWALLVEGDIAGCVGRVALPSTPRGWHGQASLSFSGLPRGAHRLRVLRIASPGLLGLARARTACPVDVEVVVRPRAHLLPALPAGTGLGSTGGAPRWAQEGEPGTVREHRPGDPARLIHWRATARRARLMVKELEAPPPRTLAVLLHAPATAPRETLDAAARAAASLLRTAMARGHPARLILPGPTGRPVALDRWEGQWDALARWQGGGPDRSVAVSAGRAIARDCTLVLVATEPGGTGVEEVVVVAPDARSG
ncbi:MAG: DUF58 domain-containing protein [Armatimonadota bacterium]|nr:DUF58 domain-containing protein [Armatimonadota bacterium]MDR7447697.1 DUF58 domain-containing protein [Armatimonadota bacterium]MDR7459032.1 DUF58 domain-containing protein [Armatimonadota bacterium]MDR7480133.1 DUF58 domain-containing protein [Armatimonadota bacterium]MDR7488890.1 DUF58 domain-containing protein [Armatimonadota bacterium]